MSMSKGSFYIALAGNPNCGKTTLFNLLTGSAQYVGNWPGVTVEKKTGRYNRSSAGFEVMITDLPGIYSLSPYSPEEIISRNYIIDEKPELIINIVDATNMERNLYLTTQLAELGTPMIIALNMYDLLKSRGVLIDCEQLQEKLGIPVFPISASKGSGVDKLMHAAVHMLHDTSHTKLEKLDINHDFQTIERADKLHMAIHSVHSGLHNGHDCIKLVNNPKKSLYAPFVQNFYPPNISDALDEISVLVGKKRIPKGISPRFVAVKLFEGDEILRQRTKLSKEENAELERVCNKIKTSKTVDRQMIIADNRYKYICRLCEGAVTYQKGRNPVTLSNKIDQVITNRFLALPIFALIVFLIFHITFAANILGTSIPSPGVFLQALTEQMFENLAALLSVLLTSAGASHQVHGLIVDGIIGGVGSVLSFTPQILLLFLFLSILEDSGYMARAAFIMDYPAQKIGLSGRSFMPLMMGFGCSVPAIMGCRTLESDRDRKMTMMLVPFMSCGAKMPIYLMITAALFKNNADKIIFSLYALGIIVAALSGFLLKSTVLKDKNMPFVMELPAYHMPSPKSLTIHLWEKLKDFLVRAGTILLGASVVIWLLSNFNFRFEFISGDVSGSMLSVVGSKVAIIFKPLGFAQGAEGWKSVVAILSGIVAKEAVVSTSGLLNYMPATPLSAFTFMVFNLLTIPCVAAIAALKAEMRTLKWTLGTIVYWFSVSWLICFVIYNVGRLIL